MRLFLFVHPALIPGILAFAVPALLFRFRKNRMLERIRILLFAAYVLLILFETLFFRTATNEHQLLLTPFWSYGHLDEYAVRNELLMNIFLFVPFGFFLPWVAKRNALWTVLLGLFFSVLIEAAQYVFCVGLCEFDDVFHNTLGAALGYGYWRGLELLEKKLGDRKREKRENE